MGVQSAIVCVDDEEAVLDILHRQLSAHFGHRCLVVAAASASAAEAAFERLDGEGIEVEVVISDQNMPGESGVELLEHVHRRYPYATKVLLTGRAGLEDAIAAINRAHLDYYVSKPWEEPALVLVVDNLLRQVRLARENRALVATLSSRNASLLELNRQLEAKIHERTHELAEANERLSRLAVTDGLTGLFNHRHFHERLALEVERSQRSGRPLSLLMIDVDHFKSFNDSYGHPAGDEVLRRLAIMLTAERRANDVVARYGGEEFSVILVESGKAAALLLAERLRLAARNLSPQADPASVAHETQISISVGVATFPDDARDAAALVRAADTALYAAKHAGRNRVAAAPPLSVPEVR